MTKLTKREVDAAAIAMWQHEAQVSPASVRNARTPRAWLDQSPMLRAKWRSFARVALNAVKEKSE